MNKMGLATTIEEKMNNCTRSAPLTAPRRIVPFPKIVDPWPWTKVRVVAVAATLCTLLCPVQHSFGNPITSVLAFTDNHPSNDLFGSNGLRLSLQEVLSSLTGFQSAVAIGENAHDMHALSPSVQGGFNFALSFPTYTGQTGPYDFYITAQGQTFGPVRSRSVTAIQLPLPQNLKVTNFELTPTLSFSTVAGANAYGLEIFNANRQGVYISPRMSQPSVTVPSGILQFGQDYYLQGRAYVTDPISGAIEARSYDYFGFRAFPTVTIVPALNVFPQSALGDISAFIGAVGATLDSSVLNEFESGLSGATAIFDPSLSWKTRLEGSSRFLGASGSTMGYLSDITQPGTIAIKLTRVVADLALNEIASFAPDGLSQIASTELSTFNYLQDLQNFKPKIPSSFWGIVLDAASVGLNAVSVALHAVALDPPDPNYKTVVQSTFVPIDHLTFPGVSQDRLSVALNLLNGIAKAEEYLRLASITANRYSSALAAGDSESALLQLMAFVDYINRYNQTAQTLSTAIGSLEIALEVDGLADLAYSTELLLQLQQNFRDYGFDPDLLAYLESLGLDGSEIADVGAKLLALDPNAFQGTLGENVTLIQQSVSDTTTASVSEPASVALLLTSLTITVGAHRLRNRRSC